MRSYRISFYNAGKFYTIHSTANTESVAWLYAVRSMVQHGHAKTKREAWKMRVICLEDLPPKKIVPKWENPNYDPNAKRECGA